MSRPVLLTSAQIRALGVLKGRAADHIHSVRDELRDLGLSRLADELGQAAVALGTMGDMHRAMVIASERGIPVAAALREVEAERAARRRVA